MTTETATLWAGLTQAATVTGEAEPLGPGGPDGCEGLGGGHKVVPSVVSSMCCLFGIVYCFFGYRCFKAVMFLTGLMFGSAVAFALCYGERGGHAPSSSSPSSGHAPSSPGGGRLSAEASAGAGLAAGALCGLLAMLVRSVGLFLVGLLLGLLLATAALVALEELSASPPRSVWVPLGLLLSTGTACAVLTLQWQRLFTTLSTACCGAAAIAAAADYFAERLALAPYVYERLRAAPRLRPVCWVTWAAVATWAGLAALGVLVQWKVTAEGYSHTKVIISRQQRHMQVMRIRQRDDGGRAAGRKKRKGLVGGAQAKAPPTEPAYRRKPNPIRRYDGDVLSPSYIQNFRERQVEVDVCADDAQPSGSGGPPNLPLLGAGPLNPRPLSSGPLNARPISSGPLSARPISSGPLSARPISSGPLNARPMSSGPLGARPMSSGGAGGPHNSRPTSSSGGGGGPLNARPMSGSGPHNVPPSSSGPHNPRPVSGSGPHNSRPTSSSGGPHNSRPTSSSGGPHNSRPTSTGGPHNSRPTSSSGGPHNSRPTSTGGPHNSRPMSTGGPHNSRPMSTGGPHNSRPTSSVLPSARPPSVGGPHAVVDLGSDYGSTVPLSEAVGPLLRI